MLDVKITTKEIPENIARRNVIIVVSWFILTITVFLLAMLVSYKFIPFMFALLLLIIPITVIIKKEALKLTKTVIKDIKVEYKNNNLYYGKYVIYVYKDKDIVTIANIVNYNKYRIGLKTFEYVVEKENINKLLNFCESNNIKINSKKYLF